MALEWIHRYIEGFGGDPTNVTVFGESSGAMDIVYHLLSAANETQPLFSRAIIQSAIFEPYLPDVASAGWHLSRLMSALQATTVEELRRVDIKTLTSIPYTYRAIDDGVFFRKDWKDFFNREEIPRQHREKERHLLRDFVHRHASRSRSRLRELYSSSRTSSSKFHLPTNLQPIIIGDCCSDSLLWSRQVSAWTGPTVVRRLKAITQSIHKSNSVLHAFEISSCTPDEEIMDRVLDLVNDARVAWPTEIIASNAKRERGGHNVWRYVFDQEGPSRGIPHHGADLVYLFDNVPLPELKNPALQENSFDDGPFDDVDDEDSYELRSNGYGFVPECEDSDWDLRVVDHFSYTRVKDAMQERWIAFAHGESPWSEDKFFVFGPEGETGERSESIFEGRRSRHLWKEAFEPLGLQMVQKLGAELSRGP
jgi:carboxylesterase type B